MSAFGEPAWTWKPWHKSVRLFHGTLGYNIAGILRHGVVGDVPISRVEMRNRKRILWSRVFFQARRLNIPLPLPKRVQEALGAQINEEASGRGAAYTSPWYIRALQHATASLEFEQDVLIAFSRAYEWVDWTAGKIGSGYERALRSIFEEFPQPLVVFHFEVPVEVLKRDSRPSTVDRPIHGWDWYTDHPCRSDWQINFAKGLRPEWVAQYDLWDVDRYLASKDFVHTASSTRRQIEGEPDEIVAVRGSSLVVRLPDVTATHIRCEEVANR